MNIRALSFAFVILVVTLSAAIAQNQNPVFRHNRSFYTSMWTANPPEYTQAGQTVPAGTMHWRAFLDVANQRREPRLINGVGTWWQPSDRAGTFPQTINTLEFRFYPTTMDAAGLIVPDLTQRPQLTIPPIPLTVASGDAFKSVTISLQNPVPVSTNSDFAICGVYPAGASSSLPGYFGLLPSAANVGYGLSQSFYGFAYASGTITHFPLGGARSSIWYTEAQPTFSVRSNWAISDSHNQRGFLNGAYGDSSYFSPFADASWPGWNDSRNPPTTSLVVHAGGQDGDFPVLLMNLGARFPGSLPFLGETIELWLGDAVLTEAAFLGAPIQNGIFQVDVPWIPAAIPTLAGSYLGFEAVLVNPTTLQTAGSTASVWLRN